MTVTEKEPAIYDTLHPCGWLSPGPESHWMDRLFEVWWPVLDRCTHVVNISLRPDVFQTPRRASSSICPQQCSRMVISDSIKHAASCHNFEGPRSHVAPIDKPFELLNLIRCEITKR